VTEREIFFEALGMTTPEARAAYLQDTCGRDITLRRRVEELLKEHFSNDSLLAGSALDGERATFQLESAPEAAPAQALGRYKLLEKVGEGGFGEVWMAEQREPVKRRVALKIIKLGMDSRQIVARFEAERQALAMMDHANIAKIFDAGTTDNGRPYFVMELVRGTKITDYCDQNQLTTRERLRLFILACQAIQHAHQKGIIHRDIKPSNILVTLHDGVPVPKVIDFGIAKATQQELTEKTLFTQFQQFMGTPAYISPEQAEMSGLDVDTRADIYSLGVLLYELLVGQTPFDAKEMMQGGLDALRQIIREKEPLRPSTKLNTLQGDARTTAGERRQTDVGRLVHQLKGDLDWIVMKCLEKDRTRRYDTASGLAADIQRYLVNEPVIARPASTAYRLLKAWRRNKLVYTAGVAVFLALAAGLILAALGWSQAATQRNAAVLARAGEETQRKQAEAAERRTEQHLYTALLEQARATVMTDELGHRVRALDALRRAGAISNTAALRGVAMSALALTDLSFVREVPVAPDTTTIQLDPAFERIALCRGKGPVEIRAVRDHHLLATLPASTNLMTYNTLWSRDGRFLAVKRDYPPNAGRSEPLMPYVGRTDWEIWDVSRVKRILLLRDAPGGAFSFHPRLPQIIVAREPASAAIWDLETGQELMRHPLAGNSTLLEFDPNGEFFAATIPLGGVDWMVAIHRATGGELCVSQRFTNAVKNLSWHPSGRWLAVPDDSGAIQLMEAQTGEMRTMGRHKSTAVVAEFSPDGRYLLSGGWDRELICWNVKEMRREFTIALDSYDLQFSRDGRQCAVVRRQPEARVQLHTFERPVHLEFAEDLGGPRGFVTFSTDGRWLAASGDERWVVWDLYGDGPGAESKSLPETRLSFAAGGELFVNPRGDGSCWRVTPGTNATAPPQIERLELLRPTGLFSLCLVSNGVVLTGVAGSRLAAYNQLASEDTRWSPTIGGLNGTSPDEQWLAIFLPNRPELHIFQLANFSPVIVLTNMDRIRQFEFSPLGDEVAVACRKGVEFWSTATWQRTGHLTNFNGIHYSPDAQTLWLSTDYSSAGLYDARTVEPLLPLPPNTRPLALSPDGRYLATSVNSRRIQLWDLNEARNQLRAIGLDWQESKSTVKAAKR
jgi:WD40 repeat protein/tRNA A-37 threonylcarbamoyl transferase component Bud32